MCPQQTFYPLTQLRIPAAGTLQKCRTPRDGQLQRFGKQVYILFESIVFHDITSMRWTVCYGFWELRSVFDEGRISAVASSSEIRARSQATHESPKSTASCAGKMFGVKESPLSNMARAVSFCPSSQCAIARMAQAWAFG